MIKILLIIFIISSFIDHCIGNYIKNDIDKLVEYNLGESIIGFLYDLLFAINVLLALVITILIIIKIF